MPGPTAREYLLSELKPALPRTYWNIVDTQRNVDEITKVSVFIKQGGFKKLRAGKGPQLLVDFVVTIASPKKDFAAAEKQLDNDVLKLAAALIAGENVLFIDAKKVTVGGPAGDRYLGYDLNIQVLDQQGVTP